MLLQSCKVTRAVQACSTRGAEAKDPPAVEQLKPSLKGSVVQGPYVLYYNESPPHSVDRTAHTHTHRWPDAVCTIHCWYMLSSKMGGWLCKACSLTSPRAVISRERISSQNQPVYLARLYPPSPIICRFACCLSLLTYLHAACDAPPLPRSLQRANAHFTPASTLSSTLVNRHQHNILQSGGANPHVSE